MAKSRKKDSTLVDPAAVPAPEPGSLSDPAAFAAPQSAGDTTVGDESRERLAQRAYELYQARGGGDGQAMDDWLTAERELRESRNNRRDD